MDGTTPAFVIEQPAVTALPVAGSDKLFPVRRVYCIGRNYAAHAVEMGHDPDRDPPFFFQKNPDNLDPSGEFPYPPRSSDVHHEAEIAVMLKSGGTNIPIGTALDHVFGYALALDMTRRDLPGEQKNSVVPGRSARRSNAPPRSARCAAWPTSATQAKAPSRSGSTANCVRRAT